MANILIADDSRFMRKHLSTILIKSGFTVIAEASNGIEAIKLYKNTQPDLVLMDIMMDGLDGLSALKQIRQIDSEAVIIICSSAANKWNRHDALASGAKDFIRKPFSDATLAASIHNALSGR